MGKRANPELAGAPTAQEVARTAGVSKWTVLRAFNESAAISDETRSKVLSVARDLGYQPNLLARSLASGRTDTATLILRDDGAISRALLAEIAFELQSQGLVTQLLQVSPHLSLAAALSQAQQRRSDAAFVIGLAAFEDQQLLEVSQPAAMRIVSLGAAVTAMGPLQGISSASVDEAALCAAAVAELLRRGLRHPVLLETEGTADHGLFSAYAKAWADAGIALARLRLPGRGWRSAVLAAGLSGHDSVLLAEPVLAAALASREGQTGRHILCLTPRSDPALAFAGVAELRLPVRLLARRALALGLGAGPHACAVLPATLAFRAEG